MERTKIACDVTKEELSKVMQASEIEKRKPSQFVRWASLQKAEEVIEKKACENGTTNNN